MCESGGRESEEGGESYPAEIDVGAEEEGGDEREREDVVLSCVDLVFRLAHQLLRVHFRFLGPP